MNRAILLSIICLLCAVSTMAADKLVVSDVTVAQGKEAVLDIGCQMQTACKAFQMDVELGSGFTLKLDAAGKPKAELGTATDHKIYSRRVSDGKYRFVVISMNGKQLPKSGSLLKLTLVAPSTAQAGSSITGSVKAIEFATAQTKPLLLSNATFKVTVAAPSPKGDVNGDNTIDVADIATIIDVMAGSADASSASADVNEDGIVDVADIATVIDIMAGGGQELAKPISVTTGSATNITYNSASVKGTVVNVDSPINVGILYGTSSPLSITSDKKATTTSKGDFTVTLSGLNSQTTYYYRAFAEANGKYYYGETKNFKTEKTPEASITVTTNDATNVKDVSATLNGSVSASNTTKSYTAGFFVATSGTPSSSNNTKNVESGSNKTGSYSSTVSGLSASTKYYFRAYVLYDGKYYYGATKNFTTTDPPVYFTCPDDNHPHAIDLGLPSGTKWACCNVGASKPEGYGDYYAWGETEEKETYSWDTYLYGNSNDDVTDIGSNISNTKYDVAHTKWGGSWKMPTNEQFKELLDNCTSEKINNGDFKGYKFTANNGKVIFIPFAGAKPGSLIAYSSNPISGEPVMDVCLPVEGTAGNYWASTLDSRNPYRAYILLLYNTTKASSPTNRRFFGCSVRPVK